VKPCRRARHRGPRCRRAYRPVDVPPVVFGIDQVIPALGSAHYGAKSCRSHLTGNMPSGAPSGAGVLLLASVFAPIARGRCPSVAPTAKVAGIGCPERPPAGCARPNHRHLLAAVRRSSAVLRRARRPRAAEDSGSPEEYGLTGHTGVIKTNCHSWPASLVWD